MCISSSFTASEPRLECKERLFPFKDKTIIGNGKYSSSERECDP